MVLCIKIKKYFNFVKILMFVLIKKFENINFYFIFSLFKKTQV